MSVTVQDRRLSHRTKIDGDFAAFDGMVDV